METQPVSFSSELARKVYQASGENINLCYQCQKCSSGCPVGFAMDYTPAELAHAIRLGLDDLVFSSKTVWLCASCETCTTRCPQDVDLAKVMDTVKMISLKEKKKSPLPRVPAFYQSQLFTMKFFGRSYELGMIMLLKLLTREFTKDMILGLRMLQKGKLKLIPGFAGALTIRKIFSKVQAKERTAR
jgi:heterodisulfide reductase subunit C